MIERLHDAVVKAAGASELRNRFREQGIEVVASASPDEFGTFLRRQVDEFAVLAKQVGMKDK